MIIKPTAKSSFVLVPNDLIYDPRISIETRGMLTYLLAKPPTWELWTRVLARELGTIGKRLGRKKLARLIREAINAGYMARLPGQTHRKNGYWGPSFYIVGMPKDVAATVKRLRREGGSA
jgi:hypothetical protein